MSTLITDKPIELLPLNARTYNSILSNVVADLREAGLVILSKNIKFVNLSIQSLSAFDG